eukprot:Pompholyxophrys_punicea_v1_NODE_603_length_1607_cov_5.250000.p1 type:complete len:111 gc:universal NODE_603_length_1607_cov_5.250000:1027-1359(+)
MTAHEFAACMHARTHACMHVSSSTENILKAKSVFLHSHIHIFICTCNRTSIHQHQINEPINLCRFFIEKISQNVKKKVELHADKSVAGCGRLSPNIINVYMSVRFSNFLF